MKGVNKVIIIGNLGADPEFRQFDSGGSVANISVATSDQWTDKQTGEKKESTEWHRIVLFNRLGEIAAQYLRKGSSVYIEGSLRTRKYQDKSGQDKYITEIRADKLQMLGESGGQQNNNNGYQNNNQNQGGYQNNNQGQGGYQGQNGGYQGQGGGYQGQGGGNYPQGNNQGQNGGFQNNMNQGQNGFKNNQPTDDDIPF